jgi:integrase
MTTKEAITLFKYHSNAALLSKSFRSPKQLPHKILERETVHEMIYNTTKQRDRLILELQARCGLRIGDLLKIKVSDVSDRTISLREPKSDKEAGRLYQRENPSAGREAIPHLLFDGKVSR